MKEKVDKEPNKVDIFNEPLLPEKPKEKKKRADSFDKDEPMHDDEEEDGFDGKAYDDLTKEQKYDVL